MPSGAAGPLVASVPDLSVVVPLFNEAENVEPLCREVSEVIDRLSFRSEVVLIDDGSDDGTFSRATQWARSDSRFSVIRLTQNYGQTAALQAGFDHAQGGVVVVMDGDLQNDPADIPLLLEELDRGFDMVTGWRVRRQDATWSRLLPSRLANLLLRLGTGVQIHDTGCALKAYRGEAIRGARLYSDMHRFLPVLIATHGASYTEIPVNHRPRLRGESKYGLSRIWTVFLDLLSLSMLSRFVQVPSRWFLLWSVPFLLVAAVGVAGATYQYSTSADPTVVYPAIAMLCSFTCLHLIFFAFLAELVRGTGEFQQLPRPGRSPEPS